MKKINNITSQLFKRNFKIAKMALQMGKSYFWDQKFQRIDELNRLRTSFEKNASGFVQNLSEMKGPIMKAGQLLSSYLGDILTPEAKKMFTYLENKTFYVPFEQVKNQIPKTYFKKLEIDETPFASASIGQVHKAIEKKTGDVLALKIQYPGIDKAIKGDIFALKMFVKTFSLVPKEIVLDNVFAEIKFMLNQELNYKQEVENHKIYEAYLKKVSGVRAATLREDFCSKKVIATELVEAHPLRSFEVENLSQKARDQLGKKFLELLFLEIYHWGTSHTDAHLGNFLIDLEDRDNPQIVVIDFGALKVLDERTQRLYAQMLTSSILGNKEEFFKASEELGQIKGVSKNDQAYIWDVVKKIQAPFQIAEGDLYDWSNSQIVEDLVNQMPALARIPNKAKVNGETFFVDRKIGNVFYILKYLKCRFNPSEVFSPFNIGTKKA